MVRINFITFLTILMYTVLTVVTTLLLFIIIKKKHDIKKNEIIIVNNKAYKYVDINGKTYLMAGDGEMLRVDKLSK